MIKRFWMFLTLCLLAGCGNSLLDDVFKHTKSQNNKEMLTAFVVLSNTALDDEGLEKIDKAYQTETNLEKKFLFEFVLAKRTQENIYILSFIRNSKNHISLLTQYDSNWVSISSPVLDMLISYSATNNDALETLLRSLNKFDGGHLETVSFSLRHLYEIDPERFKHVAELAEVEMKEIKNIIQES